MAWTNNDGLGDVLPRNAADDFRDASGANTISRSDCGSRQIRLGMEASNLNDVRLCEFCPHVALTARLPVLGRNVWGHGASGSPAAAATARAFVSQPVRHLVNGILRPRTPLQILDGVVGFVPVDVIDARTRWVNGNERKSNEAVNRDGAAVLFVAEQRDERPSLGDVGRERINASLSVTPKTTHAAKVGHFVSTLETDNRTPLFCYHRHAEHYTPKRRRGVDK